MNTTGEPTGNLILVGCMGAGKTTIGRQLARCLKRVFLDCDHEIEKRTGVKIPVIFEIEGEQGFRDRETRMLKELTAQQDIILSTGGGVVLRPENRALLQQHGRVIYLKAPVNQLYHRTRKDRNRPLLQTENPREKLRQLVRERDPLYAQLADLIVTTERRTVKQIINEIIQNLA